MDQIREIRFLKTLSGGEPFNDWYKSLKDKKLRLVVAGKLRQLQNSLYANYKSVGSGVFELRLFLGAGYRIYFAFEHSTLVIILLAGDKATQDRDIKTATKYWKEYLYDTNRF